jgi:hypothetical protein
MKNPQKVSRVSGAIYTIAQSAQKKQPQQADIVVGYGSDANETKLLNNRAKGKMITQTLALKMITYAEGEGDEEAQIKYWRTYRCQNLIKKVDGRTYGNYCGNRLCTVCTKNRRAELIRKYLPVIETWNDPYFVTLTATACPEYRLKARIKSFLHAFKLIRRRIGYKHKKGKCAKLIGIRSLESNFNARKKTYNPHFHIIVNGKEMAELLRQEWKRFWKDEYINMEAQNKRKAKTDRRKELIETIKYSTKVFSEVEKGKKGNTKMYIAALYTIDRAMTGRRLFDRFGFDLPEESKRVPKGAQVVIEAEDYKYDLKRANWINSETDEVLHPYFPKIETLRLMEYKSDMHSK